MNLFLHEYLNTSDNQTLSVWHAFFSKAKTVKKLELKATQVETEIVMQNSVWFTFSQIVLCIRRIRFLLKSHFVSLPMSRKDFIFLMDLESMNQARHNTFCRLAGVLGRQEKTFLSIVEREFLKNISETFSDEIEKFKWGIKFLKKFDMVKFNKCNFQHFEQNLKHVKKSFDMKIKLNFFTSQFYLHHEPNPTC